MKPYRLALLWALIVCLLVGHNVYLWVGQHIVPDTDIMTLLPVQKRDPILQQSFTHMVDAAQQRVIVLIGAKEWSDAKTAADAYSAVVAEQPTLLTATKITDQTQQDWLDTFKQHQLIFLTGEQEKNIREQPTAFWVENALRNLYAPFSGPKLGAWQDDPFGLFTQWVQERAQETPVRPRDGYLYVADTERQYVLLSMTVNKSVFSMATQREVTALLAQAKHQADIAQPEAEIIAAGVVLHAAAAGAQADKEVFTIGIGSLIGIILLMWFTFNSFKPILLILLSIGIGFLGSFSVCWILFGRIHLLTLVFGASLIGVAQDYGIYFLCNRLSADISVSSAALLKRLLPSLALTLVAAVIGYMGLAFTPFPGLRSMAVFSALGLIFAWLTVICWFPHMIGAGKLQSGLLVRRYTGLLNHWPRFGNNRWSLIAALCLSGLVVFGISRLDVNDDIRSLQNPPKQLIDDQIKLSKLLDAPTPVQYFLVRGATAEQVLQREETLKRNLDPLIVQKKISGYQALSNWVPSQQLQQQRKILLQEKLLNRDGALSLLGQQIGESNDWSVTTQARLLESGKALTLGDFLHSPASEPWKHLWLGNIDNVFASIVALRGLSNANLPLVRQAAVGLDGVQWVDKVNEISSVLGQYRYYMAWVVVCSYCVVFGLLFSRYRHITWRVLGPTALASVLTLSLLGLTHQHLQLFHVLAFMLLLGIGVDYGIFMQEKENTHHATAWLAVGLSAANTLLSFGLLGLSNTPALQAFGLTMLIGITLVWLIVPLFRKDHSYVTR